MVKYRVLNSWEYGLQQDTTPPNPLPATHCLYVMYFDTGKVGGGERVEPERKLEGQTSKSWVENTNVTDWI
jgi:hypothetical protein